MASTEKVLAGEVCSIDVAKKYGFDDPQTYYTPDYSDTMTYGKIDTPDMPARLCKQSKDGSVAYPSCTIIHGVPYTQDKIEPNKCIINECPPNFKKERDKCMKPTGQNIEGTIIGKKSRCDEKITDWYMIPNYHLGNKYNMITNEKKEASCMKPCPPDKIPGYIEDPVDGSSAGVLTNTTLSQCYNKNEYMAGKYNGTGNFCPIAWVYRLGQTKEDIMSDLTGQIMFLEEKNGTNIYLDEAKKIATKDAEKINIDRKTLLENVEPSADYMLSACTKLHEPSRVRKAYDICKSIHDNPKSINNIVNEKTQQEILRQACNSLFCNENDDLTSTISPGTEALCFKDIKNLKSKDLLNNDRKIEKDKSTNVENEEEPIITEPKNIDIGINTTKKAMYTGLFIVVALPIIILLGYIIYKASVWIWKNIIKRYLWCYIRYTIDLITLKDVSDAKGRLVVCLEESKRALAK